MKPAKKKTAACPAALRLEAMLPVDAGILSQQADDWTDRSVERGTVGRSPPSTLSGTTASSAT